MQVDNSYIVDIYNKNIRHDGLSGTITAAAAHNGIGTFGIIEIKQDGVIYYFAIRKLIPRECFRLMGFSDSDYATCKRVKISDTQLYKQAGNSIVVNVLMSIFGKLYDVDWEEKVYADFYKPDLMYLPICAGEVKSSE